MTVYTFAIGDVHGCLQELNELLEKIESWKEGWPGQYQYVFIGDYIDRGPDSKGVIDCIRQLKQKVVALKGNHEDMLIKCVRGKDYPGIWLGNGGRDTLGSFRATAPEDIPEAYIQWMNQRPLYYNDGKRFFVHAGVTQEPLEETPPEKLLWVRYEFLSNPLPWSRYIVHGHTPVDKLPDMYENRLNIDTACVFGGRLTAAVFNDTQVKPIDFIQVDNLSSRKGENHL